MDTLQFIANVITALAWPATVLALVLLLRRPLGQILLTLTKLKYKDLELAFGRELKQIEEQARAVEVLPSPQANIVGGPKEPAELLAEAEQLAAEFPEPAVSVAWSAVEDQLAQAAERIAGVPARRKPTSHSLNLLLQNNAIDRATVNVLKRMMNLRNEAVHERWNAFGGISSAEAREFIALARGINEKLEGIGR
jgi:hypothetical protein